MGRPSFQDVINLIKAGATLEAQEKIVELRQAMMDVQEENLSLREEVLSLTTKLKELSQSSLPNCPRCGKPTWSLKDSKKDALMGDVGMFRRLYECTACGLSEDRLEKGS